MVKVEAGFRLQNKYLKEKEKGREELFSSKKHDTIESKSLLHNLWPYNPLGSQLKSRDGNNSPAYSQKEREKEGEREMKKSKKKEGQLPDTSLVAASEF